MATLGDLERTVMDVLWDADGALTSTEVLDAVAAARGSVPATTTVLTVLSRLEKKAFVTRDRRRRPHRYRAVRTREEHTAEVMHEVLGSAPDREAVLARFVGGVDAREAEALRRMLDAR